MRFEENFLVGCNYWASHAGTAMWRDWRPDIIERDLRQLRQSGNRYLRVFPLWPDFQPVKLFRRAGGKPTEYRFDEEQALPDDPIGKAGVSQEALQRFGEFLRLAARYELKVIVGLVTGWMSGRLFVPPALEGRDMLTDPVSVMWQMRFVSCFVRQFKDSGVIIAWELGNECNCMQNGIAREAAWLWTSALAGAIRSADPDRLVLSGMHGLKPQGVWAIEDQSELLDVLTTHTYPVFTEYCDQDPVNTIRPILHSTAETRLMADISGKPCFVEEFGTLGPMIASDAIAGDYVRVCLLSLWAHDCGGLLWWCAYDQLKLPFPPYEWNATENELGMFTCDEVPEPKPVAGELKRFTAFLESKPFGLLPSHTREAVCVLTSGADFWGAAYSAFIMAKQAGFDLEFQMHDQPLKEAEIYLLPCLEGFQVMKQQRLYEILQKVRDGAVLYISNSNGKLRRFKDVTGLEVQTYEHRSGPAEVTLKLGEEQLDFVLRSERKLVFEAAGADVLGVEGDGNPAFSSFDFGKGKVFFLAFPLELELARTAGAFHAPGKAPYWKIYEHIARAAGSKRCMRKSQTGIGPEIGITEHPLDDRQRIVVLINYSPADAVIPLDLEEGWRVEEVYYGELVKEERGDASLSIRHHDGCILKVTRGAA